jgi:hypothetical protein
MGSGIHLGGMINTCPKSLSDVDIIHKNGIIMAADPNINIVCNMICDIIWLALTDRGAADFNTISSSRATKSHLPISHN